MPSFIAKSACHGRRPASLIALRFRERPHLLTRLLRERDVVRFIVAPTGFGKTALALAYAETIFSFEHVFWINGMSPCLLRDLDKETLFREIIDVDDEPALVVFDGVPALDAPRAQLLSAVHDGLLERGCEVIQTCIPTADAFSALQRDRLVVSARELLLTDEEMTFASTRPRVSDARMDGDEINVGMAFDGESVWSPVHAGDAERVPALAWCKDDKAGARFAAGIATEEVPADLGLAIITALVLQQGSVEDLSMLSSGGSDLVGLLAHSYPFVGIDEATGSFCAPALSVGEAFGPFKGRMESLVERSGATCRDEVGTRWADRAAADGRMERACAIAENVCTRQGLAAWCIARDKTLLDAVCILRSLALIDSIGSSKVAGRARLRVAAAVRKGILLDQAGALACVRRQAFDEDCARGLRAASLIIAVRYGGAALAERGEEALSGLLREQGQADSSLAAPKAADLPPGVWVPLARATLQLRNGELDYTGLREGALRGASDLGALDIVAAWAFEALGAGRVPADSALLESLDAHVRPRLEAHGQDMPNLTLGLAGLALERARLSQPRLALQPLSAETMLALRRIDLALLVQRQAYEEGCQAQETRNAVRVLTLPDAYLGRAKEMRAAKRSVPSPPVLSVTLFGALAASLGERRLDIEGVRRQKVNALFALLAINAGREIPRSVLIANLWPDSAPENAAKNFYSVWSKLRDLLRLSDGTCPYLIRHQNSCSLSAEYFESDLARLDGICRELVFGSLDFERWSELYSIVEDDFCDELLPGAHGIELISRVRGECRSRLVDALVIAARRLAGSHEPEQAIWFARSAIRRDRTREDAYVALMRAQMLAGQRTAALMTFMNCSHMLNDELGIDPSSEIEALYAELIDADASA